MQLKEIIQQIPHIPYPVILHDHVFQNDSTAPQAEYDTAALIWMCTVYSVVFSFITCKFMCPQLQARYNTVPSLQGSPTGPVPNPRQPRICPSLLKLCHCKTALINGIKQYVT